VSVIQNNGVSAIWGFSCTEVYREMVETFRIVHYIVVFAVEGFPLSEVSLYTYSEISYTVNFILKVP